VPTLHFVASLIVSLFLICLCVILAGPAFEMQSFGPRGGLQAGTLPQFVVIVVIVLAALSAVSDFWTWYTARRDQRDLGPAIAPARRVVLVGGGVMLLLAAYVFAWRPLPFPLITMVFVALVSGIIAPPSARTARGTITIGLTAVLFSIGVWLVFTYALKVPLR